MTAAIFTIALGLAILRHAVRRLDRIHAGAFPKQHNSNHDGQVTNA